MMKRRLWVTGYGGFVGSHVVRLAGDAWEIHALSHRERPALHADARYHVLDLSDTAALEALTAAHSPDAVIHCAATADIDFCERNPDAANALNVALTERLARLCDSVKAKIVFCSTDTVFDGDRAPYGELDEATPVNHYGRTKLQAEEAVNELCENEVVARVALVMGLPAFGGGNSFLEKFMTNAKTNTPTPFPENEIRTPIDVITLSLALLELAAGDFVGTIHLAGNSRLNRYAMGRKIATQLGISTELVQMVNSNAIEGRAPRPKDVSLDNSEARRLLQTPMRTLNDALALILEDRESWSW